MPEQKTKQSILKKVSGSNRLPLFAGISLLAILIVIGAIFALFSDTSVLKKDKALQNIVIGDITITPQQVKDYAQILREDSNDGQTVYEEGEDQIALKALVTNAALKKEAKEQGLTPLSDEDIVRKAGDASANEEQFKTLVSQYSSGKITQKIPQENKAYQVELQEKLIVKKNLLVAFVNYDSPYFKTASKEQLEKDHTAIFSRLGEIRDMMKNNVSRSEIEKKVDLDLVDRTKGNFQDLAQYRQGYVVTLYEIPDYSSATKFNDMDGPYPVGDKDVMYATQQKLDEELKNVGDVTNVFAAKSGMYLTAQLNSSNGGKFDSWDSMTDSYIEAHVKYAGGELKELLAGFQDTVNKSADKAIATLTTPGLEQANAQETCSQRTVKYQIVAYVKNPGSKSGNTVTNVGGARPSISFNGQTNPGETPCVSNPNVRNGYVQIGNLVYADCYFSQPSWGGGRVINGPTNGYSFWGLRVGYQTGDPWASPEIQPAPHETTRSYGSGDFAPAWSPSTGNLSNNTIYIFLIYEPEVADGNMTYYLDRFVGGDNCNYVSGRAFYRYTAGPKAGQSVSVPYTVTGPPTGWTVGPTPSPDPGFNGTRFAFKVDLGGGRPSGQQIWGAGGGDRTFVIQARVPADSGTADAGNLKGKYQSIFAPGCGTPVNPTISVSADCFGVTVNPYDQNAVDRGGGTPYSVAVYYRNPNGSPGPLATLTNGSPAVVSGSTNGPVRHNLDIAPRPGYNYGFYAQATAINISPQGYPDSAGAAGASAASGVCYNGDIDAAGASCSSLQIVGAIPGSNGQGVMSGSRFRATAVIRNLGPKPIPGDQFALTFINPANGHSWGYPNGPRSFTGGGGTVNPGETRTISFELTAPTDVSARTINLYPDYTGYFGIGASCPLTVHTYKDFNIEPKAGVVTLNPDKENPTSVTFNSNAQKTIPTDVDIPGIVVTRVTTKNGAPLQSTTTTERLGNRNFTQTANITAAFGDRYCGYITVTPAKGLIGPGDRRIDTPPGNSKTDRNDRCPPGSPGEVSVADIPYVKAYGGDVVSGGGFIQAGGACSASSQAGILAYIRPLNEHNPGVNNSGSGSQLGAFAWGKEVRGFTSASMRNAAPTAIGGNKLTFSNNVPTPSQTSMEPVLGGNLTGDTICLPDYYNETQYQDGSSFRNNGTSGSVDLRFVDDKEQTVFTNDVSVINGANYTKRHTVYVDGDVTISSNITYAPYTAITAIPNFTLVVRGNIYVSSGVTQLDGTYIAQPKDANSGKIYTCSNGDSGITDPAAIFAQCRGQQLRVNGSFIAEKVILNRVIGSLRESNFSEPANASRAAELFTFSPEVYLSPPVFKPRGSVTSGDYQYIATLPPIL